MIRYYNKRHYNTLREQTTLMIEEEDSGIYNVSKNRLDDFDGYMNSNDVVNWLNTRTKITVVRKDESILTNFDAVNKE
jgi:hypothetical protein